MTMNFTSCDQLVRELNVADGLTENIVHTLLPYICDLVDRYHVNTTKEEILFHDVCCSPIPSIILNKTVKVITNNTNPDHLLKDLCHHLSISRTPAEESIYQDMCAPFIYKNHTEMNHHPAYMTLSYLILAIFMPIGLLANLLVLMTIYRVKRLRNTTGYFISNLAIADLLVILEMLLFLTLYGSGAMTNTDIRLQKFIFPSIDIALSSASLLHVTAVSIERGIAVSMPLKYPRYLSEKRAKHAIQIIWLYCFVLLNLGVLRIWISDSSVHEQSTYEVVFFCTAALLSFFIPCALVILSYGFILVSALKNVKMEKRISRVIVVISLMNQRESYTSVRPARCREIKIALNVAMMTGPFVVVWGYFMICNMYEISSGRIIEGFENWLLTYIPFVVSCVNPLLYIMFTRSIRKSSWAILKRFVGLIKSQESTFMRRESYVTSMAQSIPDETTTLTEREPTTV